MCDDCLCNGACKICCSGDLFLIFIVLNSLNGVVLRNYVTIIWDQDVLKTTSALLYRKHKTLSIFAVWKNKSSTLQLGGWVLIISVFETVLIKIIHWIYSRGKIPLIVLNIQPHYETYKLIYLLRYCYRVHTRFSALVQLLWIFITLLETIN